jgi:cytochrome c553
MQRAGRAVALLVLASGTAMAQELPPGDAEAGRKVVRICGACHGVDGIAKNPEAANLAGQDAGYLSRQLLAFRGGQRKNEVMSVIAHGLSDQQIADVSAYYGAIEIQVTKVPGK